MPVHVYVSFALIGFALISWAAAFVIEEIRLNERHPNSRPHPVIDRLWNVGLFLFFSGLTVGCWQFGFLVGVIFFLLICLPDI